MNCIYENVTLTVNVTNINYRPHHYGVEMTLDITCAMLVACTREQMGLIAR